MGELIFVVGGAGSGKSRFAVELARQLRQGVAFVATCSARDGEMRRKIQNHREERPGNWITIEAEKTPFHLNGVERKAHCLLIDSLTLWVSDLVEKKKDTDEIKRMCELFFREQRKKFKRVIAVSDEVGLGIVPENALARSFRETLGVVNQTVAQMADQVFLVAVGLAVPLKQKN